VIVNLAVTYPLKVSRLPVFSEKGKILEKVNGFDDLMLSAATGSGKSNSCVNASTWLFPLYLFSFFRSRLQIMKESRL